MAYLLLTLTAFFWSGNFVLARGIHELIPPVSLAFWRWFGALVILLPFAARTLARQREVIRRNWKVLSLLAVLSVSSFNTFIYIALNSTFVVNTVLVNSTTPIFIVLAARISFGDKIPPRRAVGVLASLAGLVWIITRGDPIRLFALAYSRGDLWTLAAALCWALYTVFLRWRPPDLDPVAFLTAIIVLGLIPLFPLYLWEIASVGGFALSTAAAGSLLYVALFPSVLAYIFWNRGVGMIGAARAGIFMHLMPVFATFLAIVFLGERLQPYHLLGILLIFAGIFLTTASRGAFRRKKGG